MSDTASKIERRQYLFGRITRNRARRLMVRNGRLVEMDILGLSEEEDGPCKSRGGVHCLLGLKADECPLNSEPEGCNGDND